MENDKPVKLYVDCPRWEKGLKVDDFIITIGKKQSNSVYHVFSVRSVVDPKKRIIRYHVECYRSDLITALRRGSDQDLMPIVWYSRNKK